MDPITNFGKPLPLSIPEIDLLEYIADMGPITTPNLRDDWMHPNGVTMNQLSDMLGKLVALGYLNKRRTGTKYTAPTEYKRTDRPCPDSPKT